MAVEKSSEPETGLERRERNAMAFHSIYNSGILGYPTYRPILPYRMHHFSSLSPYQLELLEKTRNYIRMFCAGLLGFIFVLLICLSPLRWVKFIVIKDKKRFFAGLWTVCHHDLCWSHVPRAPYYLQFSRAFSLISALIILIIIIWLSISLTKGPGHKNYIDLGMSIFSFISGTCLFLCLILFLMQVKLYSKNILEPHFLLVYHLNWWGSVFYMIAGFLSGLNHISSRVTPPDQNLLVIPLTRTRIGNIGSVQLGLTETNEGVSTWMNQEPKRQSGSVVQPRVHITGTQAEVGTQTEPVTQTSVTQKVLQTQTEPEVQAESTTQMEPEIGNESVIRDGLTTPRFNTEIESIDTVELRLEAEIIGSVTGDKLSNSLEVNENRMTEVRDYEDKE
ncbi:transmembrane protein 202-like isoform X1 [Canis lupus baileyi]|uniref:transmembrane protein 202-like isoform X1 n=1 Tax=Canis lupus baileyi TaxID=143281 RepID=UPI000BAA19F8|eukprot:XP_022268516.1 transmembrane protein 202-like isoform X1 [Canis lupus familiaris]